jgi:hypothetical protein
VKIMEAVEFGRPKSEVAWVNGIARRCGYSFIDPTIVY